VEAKQEGPLIQAPSAMPVPSKTSGPIAGIGAESPDKAEQSAVNLGNAPYLKCLVQLVQDECSAASARHDAVLTQFWELQQSLRSQSIPVLKLPSNVAKESESFMDPPAGYSTGVVEEGTTNRLQECVSPAVSMPISGASTLIETNPTQPTSTPNIPLKQYSSEESINKTLRQARTTVRLAENLSGKRRQVSLVHTRGKATYWRSVALRAIKTDKFEMCIASLILMNAMVLCFEVQYRGIQVGFNLQYTGHGAEAHKIWPSAESVFTVIDWLFGILFILEAALKIACLASQYFCNGWNWLDLMCVLVFVIDKLASSVVPMNSKVLRLLRLMRLLRLVRFLRSLESLDVLHIMITAIKGMSRILFWAVILLSMMLLTCALLLTQVLHASYFSEATFATLSLPQLEQHRKMFEYFGSFTRCFLSMFELTLANWPPVTRLLVEEVSEWFSLLCLIHKLTIGFAVVGVINGVILQETFKTAQSDDLIMMRQKQRATKILQEKMLTLFESLDLSGDGELDFEEFESVADNPEVKTWLASMGVETDDLKTLFLLIDDDHNGVITADELARRMPRIRGEARSIDVMAIAQTMNMAGTGQIEQRMKRLSKRQP